MSKYKTQIIKGLTAGIFFCILFGISISAFGQGCETDKFTGKRKCQTPVIDLKTNNSVRANVIGVHNGDATGIVFTFASEEWRYLNNDKIYFLIDGERKSFQLYTVDREVNSSGYSVGVIEQYAIILTTSELNRLAEATTIQFRIGSDEYRLPTEVASKLQSYIK